MIYTKMASFGDINAIVKLRVIQVEENGKLTYEQKCELKMAMLKYVNKNIQNIALTSVNDEIVSASIMELQYHLPSPDDWAYKKAVVTFSYTLPEYQGLGYQQKQLLLLKNKARMLSLSLEGTEELVLGMKPLYLINYLLSHGWQEINNKLKNTRLFAKGEDEIAVPDTPKVLGFKGMVQYALDIISEVEKVPYNEAIISVLCP